MNTSFSNASMPGIIKFLMACSFSLDPTIRMSFWSLILGRMVAGIQGYSVCQSSVQRFSSIPTLAKAKLWVFVIFSIDKLLYWQTLYFMYGMNLSMFFCPIINFGFCALRIASFILIKFCIKILSSLEIVFAERIGWILDLFLMWWSISKLFAVLLY